MTDIPQYDMLNDISYISNAELGRPLPMVSKNVQHIKGDPPGIQSIFDEDAGMYKISNPSSLLQHHNQCKIENTQRLKEVRNLEDLVKFKLITVADKVASQSKK